MLQLTREYSPAFIINSRQFGITQRSIVREMQVGEGSKNSPMPTPRSPKKDKKEKGKTQKRERQNDEEGTPKVDKKARLRTARVIFCGFTEKEEEDLQKGQPDCLTFQKTISSDVTYVILKSTASMKKCYEWNCAFFACVSGCWLLRPDWLIKCRSKQEISREEEYQFKKGAIDLFCSKEVTPRGGKGVVMSTKKIVEIYDSLFSRRRQGSVSLFSDAIFQKILIVSGKTQVGRMRKNQVKLILEAGGATVLSDEVWRLIRERPARAEDMVSMVVVVVASGETKEDANMDSHFIRQLLVQRVAVLYEEFVYSSIINKVGCTRDGVLMQSLCEWEEKLKWEMSEEMRRWIMSGEERPDEEVERIRRERRPLSVSRSVTDAAGLDSEGRTIRASRLNNETIRENKERERVVDNETPLTRKRRGTTDKESPSETKENMSEKKHKVDGKEKKMEKGEEEKTLSSLDSSEKKKIETSLPIPKMDLEFDSFNILEEFNEECEMSDRRNMDEDQEPFSSDIVEPIVQMHLDGGEEEKIDVDNNYGMKSFSFSSGGLPSDLLSSLAGPSDWMDTVSHLHISIPQALARSGLDSGFQSNESLSNFDSLWNDLVKQTPTDRMHNVMCLAVTEAIKNSGHDDFLPVPSVLSRLFNQIAKPSFGMQFDADQSIFRLLSSILCEFPPCNTGGRYYWLQVLTEEPLASSQQQIKKQRGTDKEKDKEKERELGCRVAAFRKMVVDSFTKDGTSVNMMELLVNILEADLYGLREETARGSVEDAERRKSTGRVLVQGFSIDLKNVPLAYLIFYEAEERRKRGLDTNAMKTAFAFVDFIADNVEKPRVRSISTRLLLVCLEALRWFCAEVTQVFIGKEISPDLKTDIERIARRFKKHDFSSNEIRDMLPIDWIHNCEL